MTLDVAWTKRLAWWGLLAIVVISPTQYGIEVRPKTFLSLTDPLIWGVLAVWLLGVAGTPAPRSLRFPPVMVALFVGIGALSAIHAVHPLKSAKDIVQFVEYFGAAYMLAANVPERSQIRLLRDVFLGVASAVVLVGVIQYLRPGVGDFKVAATFGNRNVFGGYLSLVVPFMAGVALFEPCIWRRVGLWTVVALGLMVVLSGGAMLAMAVALLVVTLARSRAAGVVFAAVFLVLLLVVLPRLPRQNDGVLNASWQLFDDKNQVALRYTEWQAATVMIAENPWLGVGLGNYQDNIGGYFGVLPRPTGVVEHDSENLYLVLAASAGLPGLACFLGLLGSVALTALRALAGPAEPLERGLALGAAGAVLAFAICSLWSPLLVRGIGVPLALVFAFAAWGGTGTQRQTHGTSVAGC